MNKPSLLSRFLIWRVKHISNKNLVLIISVIVGIAAGLAAVVLKSGTHYIQELLTKTSSVQFVNYFYFVFPLIGILLTVTFVVFLNKGKLGHGLSHLLHTISKKSSLVPRDKTYSHMATSALTVGFGGSVGLEAPIVITGGAIGSTLGHVMHLGYKNRTLLIGCGAAGAIAAIFNAPITGVVFTLEVLLLQLTIPSFIPILLAAITGNVVTKLLLGEDVLFTFSLTDPFLLSHIPFFIMLGIITGILSVYFTRLTHAIEEYTVNRFKSRWTKALIGGFLLGLLIVLFPPLYGEGFGAIKSILAGNPEALLNNSPFYQFINNQSIMLLVIAAIVLMKVFAMNFTIAGGGNGGFFAPSLFVGALTGFLFARLFNILGLFEAIPESNFALVGMAGVMSGVLHAPLTGIFLIAEITSGYELIVPLMIVSVISYGTVRYFEPLSLYTKQLERRGELLVRDKDRIVLNTMKLDRVIERDLKTIHPDATLGELVKLVSKSNRNIFPVVDEENLLHGIILLDDIREIMFKLRKYKSTYVKDLMHAPPAFVSSTENMDEVMQKFQKTGAWNLPVVDDDKYVGFLSKSKIFTIYRSLLIKQTIGN